MNPRSMLIFWLIFSATAAIPQERKASNTRLTGYVRDAETGLGLPAANVVVRGTEWGTATDSTGRFVFRHLPAGRYLIEVRRIGYKPQIRQVTLTPGAPTRLDFGLLPEPISMEEITVESRRIDMMTQPMLSTKVTAPRIARLAPATVTDILKTVPGVATSRSGSWGNKPYFQGMTDSRILVFIDGVKVNQACPMGMDACTATLEPDLVESMDVQLGPGSAQFGSGNMGGIIRVSTLGSKFAGRPDFTTEVGLTSRYLSVSNSRIQAFSFSGGNHRMDFIAKLVAARHDDYRSARGVIANSGFDANTLHVKARYRPSMNQQWQTTLQLYRARDIGWPAANTIIPRERRNTVAVNYMATNLTRFWKSLQLNLSYQPMYHNMINYLDAGDPIYSESQSNTWNASMDGEWIFTPHWRMRSGVFFSRWSMRAWRQVTDPNAPVILQDIIPDSRLDEAGLYLETDYRLTAKWKLQMGGRFNRISSTAAQNPNSQFFAGDLQKSEGVFSGSAALLYNLTNNTAFSASITRGFRAATPVERYIAAPMLDGYYRVGSPGINSESNFSKRIGFRGFGSRFNWNIELYQHALTDMIVAEVQPDVPSPIAGLRGVKRFRNVQNAVVTGFSLYAGWRPARHWSVNTTLAYDRGYDRRDGSPLPGLAPLRGNVQLRYERPEKGFWAEVSADLAADQNRFAAIFGEVRTPGYAVFDMRLGWKWGDYVDVSLGMENLFNRYYRNHLNLSLLPEPGRNVTLRLNLTLPGPIRGKRAEPLRPEDLLQVQIGVEGMACEYCVKTVTERLSSVPGAFSVKVSLAEKRARVVLQKNTAPEALIQAVERAGFQARILQIQSDNDGN